MVLNAISEIGSAKRVVVKIGSALLVRDGEANHTHLASLADDIAKMKAGGADVIVVSSGAIALGAARLNLPKGGRASLADAQAAASVGQVALAQLWADVLGKHSIQAAQMLVTLDDLEDRRRYLNAAATLERLLEAGAVPVVNENDSVATAEIRFGDNDRLAARVAQAANADAVLLLSDVDGFYDRGPDEEGASLIKRIEGVTPEVIALAGEGSSSGLGSGGMKAKLQAARIAERAGILLAIINGTHASPISKAIAEDRGTVFLPVRADNARKAWLGGRLAPEGVLTVDAGCVAALGDGASLLAAGLTDVEGEFQRGALVSLHGPKGERLGQGLVEYSAEECRAILGLRENEQETQLGYAPRAAVVHRDHMVRT
ncbi:glutamate 5-kinase [Erythrobacter crassostreae]|uniref:Glutamate 5-kinase n=1 Tax=Erythrobacter crassostreae TaxID=2828328 RepID=A0A9X1F3F6_9SPHN|nr:glutamate 5-kinase [Erythrobacter crassostrea]MBV7259337.1 glutamate 5-kinase [Erythrobacter crassostrea]